MKGVSKITNYINKHLVVCKVCRGMALPDPLYTCIPVDGENKVLKVKKIILAGDLVHVKLITPF